MVGLAYPDVRKKENTTPLRDDLAALLAYTHTSSLPEALKKLNIKSVVEVGAGFDVSAIRAVWQALIQNGQVLTPDDVWIIEPDKARVEAGMARIPGFADQVSLHTSPVQDIAQKRTFDLLLCKGVVTIGAGTVGDFGYDLEQWKNHQLRMLSSMTDLLDPHNPSAVAVISAQRKGGLLPFSMDDLSGVGLSPVFTERINDDSDAFSWVQRFQEKGLLPLLPQNQFIRLAMCQKR
ncbi:MAG: hypothetical protein V1922_02935 [bacterium]